MTGWCSMRRYLLPTVGATRWRSTGWTRSRTVFGELVALAYSSRPVSASLLVVLDVRRQNQQVLQSGMHGFGRTREGVSVPDVAWVAALGETVK